MGEEVMDISFKTMQNYVFNHEREYKQPRLLYLRMQYIQVNKNHMLTSIRIGLCTIAVL